MAPRETCEHFTTRVALHIRYRTRGGGGHLGVRLVRIDHADHRYVEQPRLAVQLGVVEDDHLRHVAGC